jgi:hypothetical protein
MNFLRFQNPYGGNPGEFEGFATWKDVLNYAEAGGELYYHAPLNYRPKLIRVVMVYKNGKIRIDPMSSDADNFTADKHHLDRFKRKTTPWWLKMRGSVRWDESVIRPGTKVYFRYLGKEGEGIVESPPMHDSGLRYYEVRTNMHGEDEIITVAASKIFQVNPKRKPKATPTLDALVSRGVVRWDEREHQYMGRAADGVEVMIGHSPESAELYLAAHPFTH